MTKMFPTAKDDFSAGIIALISFLLLAKVFSRLSPSQKSEFFTVQSTFGLDNSLMAFINFGILSRILRGSLDDSQFESRYCPQT
jgi:hypothetical protein